jgi:hypothetical protein
VKPVDVDLVSGLPDFPRSGKLWMSDQFPAKTTGVRLYWGRKKILIVEEHEASLNRDAPQVQRY